MGKHFRKRSLGKLRRLYAHAGLTKGLYCLHNRYIFQKLFGAGCVAQDLVGHAGLAYHARGYGQPPTVACRVERFDVGRTRAFHNETVNVKSALILTVVLAATAVTAGGAELPANPFDGSGDLTPNGKIDELVFGRLKRMGIRPATVCSDGVFVRRVYLDAIGTLPTAEEARRFLMDTGPSKRDKLIDELLAREEFADYWTMKWGDLLRVKSEFPINLWPNAVQAYHRWIRTCIRENVPYDQFVREMLTASGSNFRVPQVNFYRAVQSNTPESIAEAVALTFMGSRMQSWPEDRRSDMAAFFSRVGYKDTAEWKEEIVYFNAFQNTEPSGTASPHTAVFPDGTEARLPPDRDPREIFADWLIRPENPWFTGSIVNRIWYWLLGRGIVHEPDDIRRDNPPSNPELLTQLRQELVAARFDLKHIYRLILKSKTYQLASTPTKDHPEARAQFAYYPMRRLDAEVLIDALCQVTGTTESYSSIIPEPYSFIPEYRRAVALPDGSITSAFLEMFGRSPRDTGLESERNNRVTPAQQLHLLNSSHIRQKIEQAQRSLAPNLSKDNFNETVVAVYLTILSRFPTDGEWQAIESYAGSGKITLQQALFHIIWALINSPEFLYRH